MVTQPWRLKLLSEFTGIVLVTTGGETWIGRGHVDAAIDYFVSNGWVIWGLEGFRTDGSHVIATAYVTDWDEDPALANLDWPSKCRESANLARTHCHEWFLSGEVEFVEFNIETTA